MNPRSFLNLSFRIPSEKVQWTFETAFRILHFAFSIPYFIFFIPHSAFRIL